MQQAVLDAVEEINSESHEEPNHKPDPGNRRKSRHEEDAGCDAQKRNDWTERHLEGTMFKRLFDPQDDCKLPLDHS